MRISKREILQNGFTVIIEHVLDEAADFSWLMDASRYEGVEDSERAKYEQQDAERMEGFRRGDWYPIGVVVTVRKQTASNWANGGLEVGRASVWGVESDAAEHLAEVERETITDALAEVDSLRVALGVAA